MTTPPPLTRYPKAVGVGTWDDPAMQWISTQIRSLPMKTRDLLDASLRSYKAKFSEGEPPGRIGECVLRDMHKLQLQPAMLDEYRRFVIIKADRETLNDKREEVSLTRSPPPRVVIDFFLLSTD